MPLWPRRWAMPSATCWLTDGAGARAGRGRAAPNPRAPGGREKGRTGIGPTSLRWFDPAPTARIPPPPPAAKTRRGAAPPPRAPPPAARRGPTAPPGVPAGVPAGGGFPPAAADGLPRPRGGRFTLKKDDPLPTAAPELRPPEALPGGVPGLLTQAA